MKTWHALLISAAVVASPHMSKTPALIMVVSWLVLGIIDVLREPKR